MKHLQYIEYLYQKQIETGLSEEDLKLYEKKFNRQLNIRPNDFYNAVYMPYVRTSSSEYETTALSLSTYFQLRVKQFDLTLYKGVGISIPFLYITLDGSFKERIKTLLDKAFFDPEYPKIIDNSYLVLIEKSDIRVHLTVLHSREEGVPVDSSISIIKKGILDGYLLSHSYASAELMRRQQFLRAINLECFHTSFLCIHSKIPRPTEFTYYYDYLKEKWGYPPDGEEQTEILKNDSNKWLYQLLFLRFEYQVRLYEGETIRDVAGLYQKLGFNDVRFIGKGLLDFTGNNVQDYILNSAHWPKLGLEKFKESEYNEFSNMDSFSRRYYANLCNILIDFSVTGKGDIETILQYIGRLNMLVDPTLDARPGHRHPVTYAFCTTPRFIPVYLYVPKRVVTLSKELIPLSSDVKVLIETIAANEGFHLTENKDEFYLYEAFYIRHSKHAMDKKLQDPVYTSAYSGDFKTMENLLLDKLGRTKEEREAKIAALPKYKDPWVNHGIRKHLKLTKNEGIR